MTTERAARATPNAAWITLAALAAVFCLPLLIAGGLFWLDWRPARFDHHGELLQPPQPLPVADLRDADGRALPDAQWHGKWLLLVAVDAACDASCLATLQQMQRVHIALNKDQERLRRVLLVGDASAAAGGREALAQVQRRFPDLLVATLPAAGAIDPAANATIGRQPTIYLVDPLARVMMRYAQPTRGVFKDLERLLKYSWIR